MNEFITVVLSGHVVKTVKAVSPVLRHEGQLSFFHLSHVCLAPGWTLYFAPIVCWWPYVGTATYTRCLFDLWCSLDCFGSWSSSACSLFFSVGLWGHRTFISTWKQRLCIKELLWFMSVQWYLNVFVNGDNSPLKVDGSPATFSRHNFTIYFYDSLYLIQSHVWLSC